MLDKYRKFVGKRLQHDLGDVNGGNDFAICKQYGVVKCWSSPYTAMAPRACIEDSHHKLHGPTCDHEYQLATRSSNIEQSRILVAEGNVGFFKSRADVRQAGIAAKKTESFMLQFGKHVVVAGLCSYRVQAHRGSRLRTSSLCRCVTTAWYQLAVNAYTHIVAAGARSCTALGATPKASSPSCRPAQSASIYCRGTSTNSSGWWSARSLPDTCNGSSVPGFSWSRQASFICDSGVTIQLASREKVTHLVGEARKLRLRLSEEGQPCIRCLSTLAETLQTSRMAWRKSSEATSNYDATSGDDRMEGRRRDYRWAACIGTSYARASAQFFSQHVNGASRSREYNLLALRQQGGSGVSPLQP